MQQPHLLAKIYRVNVHFKQSSREVSSLCSQVIDWGLHQRQLDLVQTSGLLHTLGLITGFIISHHVVNGVLALYDNFLHFKHMLFSLSFGLILLQLF